MKAFPYFFLLLASWAFAANPKTETSKLPLKQLAIEESLEIQKQLPSVKKESASDAQVSGLLSFQDSFQELAPRNYLFSFSAGLEPMVLRGQGRLGGLATYSLEEAGQGLRPQLSLGFLKKISTSPSTKANSPWSLGARVGAGFLSQNLKVFSPMGTPINTRLNSSLISVGPEVRFQYNPKWAFGMSAEYGEMLITSSSENSLGQWNEGQSLMMLKAAGLYQIDSSWLLKLALKQTSKAGQNNPQLDVDSFGYELGAEVLW